MTNLCLKPERVFSYFKEISSIPHGSGNCGKITEYCINFAKKFGLRYYSDDAGNVVIYKQGTPGYENSDTVILQGHLDMVCQKTDDCNIDFNKDGLSLCCENGFLSANGTTLGADNGIAVAMILSVLESSDIKHPPIEAVFTTDEEVGMIGAGKLDMSVLSGKYLVNIDSEEEKKVFVSCAGGSEISAKIPLCAVKKTGFAVTLHIQGLLGGHSGVEINSGRINSNILAGRYLNYLNCNTQFDIISVDGGDKGNAITNSTKIKLLTNDAAKLCKVVEEYNKVVFEELASREPGFKVSALVSDIQHEYNVFSENLKIDVIYLLYCIPNGVQEMSADVKGLVETSLNLGIVSTNEDSVNLLISLRSNKVSALTALEEKVKTFLGRTDCTLKVSGFYPPWEYKRDSALRNKYIDVYKDIFGFVPTVEAIHAGLECGVFASKIKNIDCIAIGPDLFDVHTVNEKLDILSTERIYNVIISLLENLK